MKDFISTFFVCFVICLITTLFFVYFMINNLWTIIIFAAFVLAVFITAFINQAIKIEDLEEKVEKLLDNKQD